MFGTVSYFLSYDCTDDNAYMQGSFSSALQEDMSAYISSQSADDVTTTVVVSSDTDDSLVRLLLDIVAIDGTILGGHRLVNCKFGRLPIQVSIHVPIGMFVG